MPVYWIILKISTNSSWFSSSHSISEFLCHTILSLLSVHAEMSKPFSAFWIRINLCKSISKNISFRSFVTRFLCAGWISNNCCMNFFIKFFTSLNFILCKSLFPLWELSLEGIWIIFFKLVHVICYVISENSCA